MFLQEPQPTSFDLRFQVLGFPVRVHPAFFLMPLILGGSLLQGDNIGQTGLNFLILSAVFFLSILVHELGHTLAMRYFGESSHIVLYWLGGLAIPDQNRWSMNRAPARTPWTQIAISAAGPLAGMLLGLVLIGLLYLLGGRVFWQTILVFPIPLPDLSDTNYDENHALWIFLASGMFACFFWNLLNLAPVLPLDGGQISQSLFSLANPWNGIQYALMLSIATAAGLAIWSFGKGGFGAIFFAYLAFESYLLLQQIGGGGGGRRPW